MIAPNPSCSTAPGASVSQQDPTVDRGRLAGAGATATTHATSLRHRTPTDNPGPATTQAVPRFPVLDLREFANGQVEALGLRGAARAADLSPGTLKNFVGEAVHVPRPDTRRKLEIWFWRVQVHDLSASEGSRRDRCPPLSRPRYRGPGSRFRGGRAAGNPRTAVRHASTADAVAVAHRERSLRNVRLSTRGAKPTSRWSHRPTPRGEIWLQCSAPKHELWQPGRD